MAEKRRRESERDAQFESEWTELLVVGRGVGLLEEAVSGSEEGKTGGDDNATDKIFTSAEMKVLNAHILQTRQGL